MYIGKDHHHIAFHQADLANIYLEVGQTGKAQELLESALKINLEHFGETSQNVAMDKWSLAIVFYYKNDYQQARQFALEAYRTFLDLGRVEDSTTKEILEFIRNLPSRKKTQPQKKWWKFWS